jgi:16S rRNA processing protein RimM
MNPVDPESLFLVGRIVRSHGVRGEMKVAPETDDPGRFAAFEMVYVGTSPTDARPLRVRSVRSQQGSKGLTIVLSVAGVDDRDEADRMRKLGVYVHQDDLPPLDEDEMYLHDLIGMDVVTTDALQVGKVHDILDLPAHPVYVVARDGRPDVMIPAVPAFITEVDTEARRITVAPIEGLLEDSDEE